MAHEWNDFYRFKPKYMPSYGDGDTMSSQAETALSKLVYKWFNDGDVFDNHYGMSGWVNDISGSANWLHSNFPGASTILNRIYEIGSDDGKYEDLLYDLCCLVYDTPNLLDSMNSIPKVGSAYNYDGPYSFDDGEEDEDY